MLASQIQTKNRFSNNIKSNPLLTKVTKCMENYLIVQTIRMMLNGIFNVFSVHFNVTSDFNRSKVKFHS